MMQQLLQGKDEEKYSEVGFEIVCIRSCMVQVHEIFCCRYSEIISRDMRIRMFFEHNNY